MSRRERDKGARGERELGALLEAHGFTLRVLAHTGDRLAFGHGLTLHVESKWQETARPWLWWEQASSETPPGALTLVGMRRSRSPWLALVSLEELLPRLWTPMPDASPTGVRLSDEERAQRNGDEAGRALDELGGAA